MKNKTSSINRSSQWFHINFIFIYGLIFNKIKLEKSDQICAFAIFHSFYIIFAHIKNLLNYDIIPISRAIRAEETTINFSITNG